MEGRKGNMAETRVVGQFEVLSFFSKIYAVWTSFRRATLSESSGLRAIVYLTVQWSVQERQSRKVFEDVCTELSKSGSLAIGTFILDENDPVALDWLHEKAPVRSGAMLWVENGKSVATDATPYVTGANEIVQKTRLLWGAT
jgi:hypothetical protein